MLNQRTVKIKCVKCTNSKSVNFSKEDKQLYNQLEISNISELNRLVLTLYCKKCNTKRPNIYLDEKLVFDQDNLKICFHCNLPISNQRLETFPNTNLCSSSCVEDVDKISKIIPPPPALPEKEKIGRCGHQMEVRFGKHGWFIGCSKYPSCRNTKDLNI